MGNSNSRQATEISANDNRAAFVTYKGTNVIEGRIFNHAVFSFNVRYLRYSWEVTFRYNDILAIDNKLRTIRPEGMNSIFKLQKKNKIFWQHDDRFMQERVLAITKWLQDVLDREDMRSVPQLLHFLGASKHSFYPELGRKGKEGYLKKCSGGFIQKFSRTTGDYINVWKWRWIVLRDNCIMWFKSPDDDQQLGALQIDNDISVVQTGRVITVSTSTRRLNMYAATQREADEWTRELLTFYPTRARMQKHPFNASFPVRSNIDVRVYTVTRDYYRAAAIAILGAQKEIFITSWKMTPNVLVTRPPFPPMRLDQLLQYKAEQGVKIYVLLYKEVEHIGQGNDSQKVKQRLESLAGSNGNIRVIRHPNKFIGGSTALLWSHHEKLLIIDRNVAFVGGVDLAFQRYDDELHQVTDELGVLFPGHDYRQPAPAVFKPARSLEEQQQLLAAEQLLIDEDENPHATTASHSHAVTIAELAVAGEQLPLANININSVDEENLAYEAEVVLDFSVVPGHGAGEREGLRPGVAPSAAVDRREDIAVISAVPRSPASHLPTDESSNPYLSMYRREGDLLLPPTPEEMQAMEAAEQSRDDDLMSVNSSIRDTQRNNAHSQSSSAGNGHQSTSVLRSRISELSSSLQYITSEARNMLQSSSACSSNIPQSKSHAAAAAQVNTIRDLYPRMGWHDLQCMVNGEAARDVASHFVQRWNHHRLSTSSYSEPILVDITDDLYFTICARCQLPEIHESAEFCPRCSYHLGRVNVYSQPVQSEKLPVRPEHPSLGNYLIYEVQFDLLQRLPIRLEGDCPVIVTTVHYQEKRTTGVTTTNNTTSEEEEQIEEYSYDAAGNLIITYKTSSHSPSRPTSHNFNISDNNNTNSNNNNEGTIIALHGEEFIDQLLELGIRPATGDVLLKVDDLEVGHLNSHHVKRILAKKKKAAREHARAYTQMNQHRNSSHMNLLETVSNPLVGVTVGHDSNGQNSHGQRTQSVSSSLNDSGSYMQMQASTIENIIPTTYGVTASSTSASVSSSQLPVAVVADQFGTISDNNISSTQRHSSFRQVNSDQFNIEQSPVPTPMPVTLRFRRHYLKELHDDLKKLQEEAEKVHNLGLDVTSNIAENTAVMTVDQHSAAQMTPGKLTSSAPLLSDQTEVQLQLQLEHHDDPVARKIAAENNNNNNNSAQQQQVTTQEVAAATTSSPTSTPLSGAEVLVVSAARVCQAAAHQETLLNASLLFHQFSTKVELAHRLANRHSFESTGSCKVQVLRSAGKWSLGLANTECSIMNAYIEAVKSAERFIYIENQFFVSSLAGEQTVSNGLALALAERIIRAHHLHEPLKVILLLPVHPNGDFLNAMKAKVVMHFEYETINRGISSLFNTLRKRAPGLNISEYLSIHSLRSHGILQGRVVNEQVYVHDKLMIVDDRVLILGSANINDRSLLGVRDSEVAVRIEDTLLVESAMSGEPYVVGYLPHSLRVTLMRQHIQDPTFDCADPLAEATVAKWRFISQTNSSIFDELDGELSLYRCVTISQYRQALSRYTHKHALDSDVRQTLSELRGFLVDWPQNLFKNEDLSPSLATRAIIPNELWV